MATVAARSLFPFLCVGCGKEQPRSHLCSSCRDTLFQYINIRCPLCGKRLPEGKLCDGCAIKLWAKRFIYAFPYPHPIGKAAIHSLKYNFIRDLARPLGAALAHAIHVTAPDWRQYDLLAVPVPLAKARLNWRGFNHAELIAQTTAAALGIPMETTALLRTRKTRAQRTLPRAERFENIASAFIVENKHRIEGRTILLIDDVATTGATLKEAAITLKQNGARAIWCAAVAKE